MLVQAQWESKVVALLFLKPRRYRGLDGQRLAPAALRPEKKPGTHFRGGWLSPRVYLNMQVKSHPHRD